MRAKSFNVRLVGLTMCLAGVAAGCGGDVLRQDRSPVSLVIESLAGASGATGGTEFSGTLQSDVITVVDDRPTIFSDSGRVIMSFVMKDILSTPSTMNAVKIERYRITFRRSDGRNTPGVDVPYPFDSAVTFTIAPGGTVTQGFELIRHVAKSEAPLAALQISPTVISTVADITFYGHDLAGNELSASGSLGIQFGNFADPD